MRFYLLIGKDAFYVYRAKGGNDLETEYIYGNPFLRYSPYTVKADIDKLKEALADTYSLDSPADVDFTVIENSDRVRNENVAKALGGQLKAAVKLSEVLARVINELVKDPKLRLKEFGINYDGESYRVRDGKWYSGFYSLLAYTVGYEDIARRILG